jgi:hypothetical protein
MMGEAEKLVEQDKIENVSAAYLKFISIFLRKKKNSLSFYATFYCGHYI